MADLLRETFAAYAERAPRADGLGEAVQARLRAGRARRRLATVAGAAATAAAVVAGVAVVGGEPAPRRPDRGERPPLAAEPPAPPGTRWEMWRGIEVAVPEAWLDARYDACGNALSDAVVLGWGPSTGDCALRRLPHVTLVRFTRAGDDEVASLTRGEDVVVSGVPGRRVTGTAPVEWREPGGAPQHAEALVFAERDVAVLVTADDPAVADRVLDTVRVSTGRDSRGCEVDRAARYADEPPARDGAREHLVPGAPVQASVCRYDSRGRVLRSALVTDGVPALAATLNGLAPGFGTEEPGAPQSWFAVTFRYAEGPDVVVHVNASGPRDVGASNGAVTGRLSRDLEDTLRPLAGWRYHYDEKAVRWS